MLLNRVASSVRVAPFTSTRSPCRIVCQAAATEPARAKKVHPSPLSQAAPSTYAIIEVGGTQMFVEAGKWYTVNRLKADVGSKIKFGRVLALKNKEKLTVGTPYLDSVNVSDCGVSALALVSSCIAYQTRAIGILTHGIRGLTFIIE